MDPTSPSTPTEPTPSTEDALLTEIDGLLRDPEHPVSFSPMLEREYETQTGLGRDLRIGNGILGLGLATLLCALIDLHAFSGRWHSAAALRFLVALPLSVVCAWGAAKARQPAGHTASVMVALVGQLAVAVTIGLLAEPPYQDRYLLIAGMMVVQTNLFLPLRTKDVVRWTLSGVAVFCAMVVLGAARPFGELADLVLFVALSSAASTVHALRNERTKRWMFLLRARDVLRTGELMMANQRLRQITLTDPLTGIGNRRSFDLALDGRCAQSASVGVLMIDVDFFKLYNDHFGHAEGDECLKKVARALESAVTEDGDTVARYGGEEFGVVCAEVDAERLHALAERARKAVEALELPHPKRPEGGNVTISVGGALLQVENPSSVASLVPRADAALYLAKRAGRNRVRLDGAPETFRKSSFPKVRMHSKPPGRDVVRLTLGGFRLSGGMITVGRSSLRVPSSSDAP